MKTRSVWEPTKTFFPLFLKELEGHFKSPGTVSIVGASDGKFVIPLAARGWRVVAIEVDPISIDGGVLEFPVIGPGEILGLIKRMEQEGIQDLVEVVNDNFLTCKLPKPGDGVFTSCSWHYSRNHAQPLIKFVEQMQGLVAAGGIFCAEYMMPCEDRHANIEHYVRERQLRGYFGMDWKILEEFYTEPFIEEAHVGNLSEHLHRMGFFMAQKLPTG